MLVNPGDSLYTVLFSTLMPHLSTSRSERLQANYRSRCAKLRGCEMLLCIQLTFRSRHDKLPAIHSMMKGSEMALCYKNLWKLLIDRDMTRKDLHRVSGVSHATLAKMSRGESVTASVLDRICNSLDCRIENVMEITPDKPCEVNRRRAQDENGGAQLKRRMK